jgi:uncharacterized protein YbaP (TraB family)
MALKITCALRLGNPRSLRQGARRTLAPDLIMLRLFVFLLLLPIQAAALCQGQDLRSLLTEDEQVALQTQLAEIPYAAGNHWRATKEDKVLHLVGTLHLTDPRLEGPATRITPIVETAGHLLLEATAVEKKDLERQLASDPSILFLEGETLIDLLPKGDWDRLAIAMQARGVPSFMAAKMRPWYVSMLLGVPTCMDLKAMVDRGLDAKLEAVAKAHAIPTTPLEDPTTLFKAFSTMDMELQIAMIRSALMSPESAEDLFETVLLGYFNENHAELQLALEMLTPHLAPMSDVDYKHVFDAMNSRLLDARNRAWIPVILDSLEQTEGHVVAAFGAAHLAGPNGVLALLEAEGFTLERLPF